MSEWVAFWMVVGIYVICECILTLNGVDTFLWKFKTPEEKVLQRSIISNKEKP